MRPHATAGRLALSALTVLTAAIPAPVQEAGVAEETRQSLDGGAERPHLAAALDVARWLATVSHEEQGGTTWPADIAAEPGSPERAPGWSLYAGVPGVVLFHLELWAATGDERWGATAQRGAEACLAWVGRGLQGSAPGLYTGSAGVAFALTESWRATHDERYRAGALAVLEHLHASAERTDDGVRWSEVTDVIGGDAGVGFLLLHTAEVLERPQDLRLAADAGRDLLARGTRTEHGLDWAMSPSYPRRMPNFSHGTAGVATFLAALAVESGEEGFLEGALAGARRLLAIADPDAPGFRVHHHSPEGEDLFYLGWCHGPAGTARLFRALARATGDRSWADVERRAARTLLEAGLPEARPDGYWDNVGVCCGAAGVATFLLDHHARGGDEAELALARALTADLLARGTRDASGLRWTHCEHRVRPELRSTQTGWMQGAAGIGHALLRLDALETGRSVSIVLPDDRY